MSAPRLSLVFLLTAIAACCGAIKMTPELEKCAVQLLRMLAKETNPAFKEGFTKILKHAQAGAIADGQKLFLSFSEADRATATSTYLVGDCLPMKSCLDCPVEL